MNKTVVKLNHPIKVSGVEVSELKFRRPTVRDVKAAKTGKTTDELDIAVALAANLSEVSPDDILNLDLSDFKAVEKVIADFMEPSKG